MPADSHDAYKPAEIAALIEVAGVAKAALPLHRLGTLAALAGAFIGFGAAFWCVAMAGADPGFGPARVLGGMVFALGLILVVVGGAELFTDNAAVRAAGGQYLSTAAPLFAFVGLSISLYFSSQGAAKVLGPVLAQTARLVFIVLGGWWLSRHGGTATDFFWLAAASMVLLGVLAAAAVRFTDWGARKSAAAA